MPVDSRIALAGKPPVLEPVDWNKSFKTLSELKYLNAEAARTQAQTGLVETQGQAAQADLAASNRLRAVDPTDGAPAGYGTISSLRTGAVPSGGQAYDEATLPQGGSTPSPGAPAGPPPTGSPAAARPRRTTAELAAAYLQADPIKGQEIAAKLFEYDKSALDHEKGQLELGAKQMSIASAAYAGVTDQASLERANALVQHVTGRDVSHLPHTYSPQAIAQVAELERTAQARLEQANKVIEQKQKAQQLETEAFTARTGRIEATKPLAAGTGYFQHPDGTWTPMAPQPTAPGALRSPQGQGQLNTLSSEYEAGSKGFAESTAAFNQTVPLLKDKTNTSDLMALRGFQKLSEPGQAIGVFGGKQTEALGNIMEQITGEISRLTTDKGATIAEPLRLKMAETARKLHAIQIDQHLQFRDDIRTKARNQGLPPDEAAPNRLTTYGSGNRDKVLTQAQFQEILTHERAKGKTRGEVYLDLAQNGYTVRGGPQ